MICYSIGLALRDAGIEFRGYLPNLQAPRAYAQSRLALHVPRHQYANGLSGIPTIRVFEALACGAPLVCSPWTDSEGLFRPGAMPLDVLDRFLVRARVRQDDCAIYPVPWHGGEVNSGQLGAIAEPT